MMGDKLTLRMVVLDPHVSTWKCICVFLSDYSDTWSHLGACLNLCPRASGILVNMKIWVVAVAVAY